MIILWQLSSIHCTRTKKKRLQLEIKESIFLNYELIKPILIIYKNIGNEVETYYAEMEYFQVPFDTKSATSHSPNRMLVHMLAMATYHSAENKLSKME
jgi:hypothetical protein